MSKIVHKPITNKEYNKLFNHNALTDLLLNTGARISEIKRLIDDYVEGIDYMDIITKYSKGRTNRIYLNENAKQNLKDLLHLKGISVRTLQRHIDKISNDVGVKFSSHNLRSTFAVRLYELGTGLVTVSTLLNHTDINITAKYIIFSENRLRASLSTLGDYDTIEGMTMADMHKEILKLRRRAIRNDQRRK